MTVSNLLRRSTPLALMAITLAGIAAADAPAISYPFARETKNPTGLDKYVAEPDPHYAYKLATTFEGSDYTSYVLELTSQEWGVGFNVDRTLWTHQLHIVIPKQIDSSTAFFLISGGGNGNDIPKRASALVVDFAQNTHAIAVELKQVPNQPLQFDNDGRDRVEDSIIAYTWDKYMRTGNERWPLRMPMTKSAVRGMDAVQAFVLETTGKKVEDFVVAGASKRGWTTWTTGIVDTRVKAIIPIVIDMLNIVPSFQHHWRVYGAWAPAIDDYTEQHIMDWMGSPEYDALMKLVEPYSYIDRLTMPKFLVNGSSDQFFVSDSSRYYWDDLKGPKYLRYVPNAGHDLLGSDAIASIATFTRAIEINAPIPQYAWTVNADGAFRVETPDKPVAVKLWHATNPEARTFRIDVVGKIWEEQTLEDQGGGVFVGGMPAPEKGWTGYFVELTFDVPNCGPLKFTTPIRVTPDTDPFEYKTPQWPEGGFIRSKQ